MKTRAVILAGGEGSRLGVLTAKRTKPAVPFAGRYRIIDFTLSNCVNSNIFDVMILAQYRPHSLIEHIGGGAPWDLNRDFTGGMSILTPYKARTSSDWYLGTADAVQQNFLMIKRGPPDLVLILSGDHIYTMDYQKMIAFHHQREADLTIATIQVPKEEASRFGILGLDHDGRVTDFIEKPVDPPSNQVNMGVYLFSASVLDRALWKDHQRTDSSHDFGKDILPSLVQAGKRIFAYPYDGYWVDVGTVESYWKAQLDLLNVPPPVDLNDRSWIIHTRTEERPPAFISKGTVIEDSLVTDGCWIEEGAKIVRSVLSPGVRVGAGAYINESVVLTDTTIEADARIEHSVIDKRVLVCKGALVGSYQQGETPLIAMIGKNTTIPANMVIESGAVIGPDVIESDYPNQEVRQADFIQTKRMPYEI
jgi:glucose-1-phosphate adenylyltransferase